MIRASTPLLALAMLLLDGASLAAGPVVNDRYYVFRFGGEKAGYVHARDHQEADGTRVSWRETVLSLRRGSVPVRIRMEVESRSGADYAPQSFTLLKDEDDQQQRVTARRDASEMQITVALGGQQTTRMLPLPKGTLFSSVAEQLVVEAKLEPGQSLTLPVFLEEANQVAETRFTLLRRETRTVNGQAQPVLVLQNQMLGITGTEVVLASDGTLVTAELPALGTRYDLADRAEALAAAPGPDLLRRARYETKIRLDPSERLARLRLRLLGADLPTPPWAARQRLISKRQAGEPGLILELTPERTPSRASKLPIREPGLKRFLAPTTYEQSDDPRIRAAATRARGESRDAWAVAQRLSRWVHLHITNKSMDRPYLSALETLQQRTGDCTEHAILFSALAKASGLPARIVNGLAYVDGAFAYHEWAEVYVGPEGWVAVDPTFDQAPVDAAHLALVVGASDDEGMLEAGLTGLRYLSGLTLEVLEAVRFDGTRVAP